MLIWISDRALVPYRRYWKHSGRDDVHLKASGDLDALMPGMGVVMGGLGNRILAEIDGTTGVTSREYIWLGDRVIAVAPTRAPAGPLYWVSTDHLARPVQMTSGS